MADITASGPPRRRWLTGWVRLWIVLTLIGCPATSLWAFNDLAAGWAKIDAFTIKTCVEAEASLDNHPDALKCGEAAGTAKTVFQREGISPLAYWTQSLGLAFLADLILTALVAGAVTVVRWVIRGFRKGTRP